MRQLLLLRVVFLLVGLVLALLSAMMSGLWPGSGLPSADGPLYALGGMPPPMLPTPYLGADQGADDVDRYTVVHLQPAACSLHAHMESLAPHVPCRILPLSSLPPGGEAALPAHTIPEC